MSGKEPRLGSTIAWTLGRQVAGAGIAFLTSIFLARMLGRDGYGMYSVALLLPMMLGTFLEFGVGPANVYFIGNRSISYRDLVRWNGKVWLTVSVVGLLAGAAVTGAAGEMLFPGVPGGFLLLALAAFPVFLLRTYAASILQGVQDFRHYNQLALVTPGVTLAAALLFVGLLGWGPMGAVASFVVGSGISCLFGVVHVARTARFDAREPVEHRGFRWRHLQYGWRSHASNVLSFINYRADLFLVNLLLSPAAAGVYVIAIQLAERIWMLSQSASVVALPRLARLQADSGDTTRVTSLVTRWVLHLSLLVALVVALLARPLIGLLFGEEYVAAATAIVWLLPGIVLGGAARILANDLAARGRPELNMYTAIVVVAVNVGLNLLLIPPLGIAGAALATTLAYVANALIKTVLYVRLSGGRILDLIVPRGEDWEEVTALRKKL